MEQEENKTPSQRCVCEIDLPWLNPSVFLLCREDLPPAAGHFISEAELVPGEEEEVLE